MSTPSLASAGGRTASLPNLSNNRSQTLPRPRPRSTANCNDYWVYQNGISLERNEKAQAKRVVDLHTCPATPRLSYASVMSGPSTPLSHAGRLSLSSKASTSFATDSASPGTSFDVSLVSDHSTTIASDNSSYLDFSSTDSPATPSRSSSKRSAGLIGLGFSGMGESSGFWRGTGIVGIHGSSPASPSSISRQFLDEIYLTVSQDEELDASERASPVDIVSVDNSFENALSQDYAGLNRAHSASLHARAVTSTPIVKKRLSLSRTEQSPISPTISSILKRSEKSPKAKPKSTTAWRV